ncbi:MAG: hypothetical protein Q8J92_06335 [Parvibaculum sp.]|nr:hypothetical protein [Parvibaculum sp.]
MAQNLFERIADECVDLYRVAFRRRRHLKDLLDRDFRIGGLARAMEEQRTARNEMEAAVDRIMGAAERMVAIDFSDPDAAAAVVADCCGELMEACSFQDITGQRIAHTIETLGALAQCLDALENDNVAVGDVAEKSSLLNGPALPGNGLGQGMVDELLMADDKS